MKKILTVALVLALAVALVFALTACGIIGGVSGAKDEDAKDAGSANSGETAISGTKGSAAGNKKGDFNVPEVDKSKRVSDMEITNLKVDKESFKVDEPITFTVEWSGTYAESAWIGIVPAEVAHGDEEENDSYDLDYIYFGDLDGGREPMFEITLEPGDYTLRVNESDDGGAELAWCAFKVK